MTSASAPGKIILAGEHAVVYGRPAIAAPIWEKQATATIRPLPPGSGCRLEAPQIGLALALQDANADQALALAVRLALRAAGYEADPDWRVEVQSTIPIASGLGSGAAICSALVRAVFRHVGHPVRAAEVSRLVFRCEEIFHGAPSGIDNAVVAYGQLIWFTKGAAPAPFLPGRALHLVIADSGVAAPTIDVVHEVRRRREATPAALDALFDQIADVVHGARAAIDQGDIVALGQAFNANHELLVRLGVSSPLLDQLTAAACAAGAAGAKLSGAGWGGNVIALVEEGSCSAVAQALSDAGAKHLFATSIQAPESRAESRK